ncbi:MAG: hypothetical protein ABIA78_01045 [archaeon]
MGREDSRKEYVLFKYNSIVNFELPMKDGLENEFDKLYVETVVNIGDLGKLVFTRLRHSRLANVERKDYCVDSPYGEMVKFVIESHEKIVKRIETLYENGLNLDASVFE